MSLRQVVAVCGCSELEARNALAQRGGDLQVRRTS
jgi:hypothetical protein